MATILAIESSCDETSAAVCKDGKMLSNIIATQQVHQKYGGVVPELASRAHQQHIIPVVEEALSNAKVNKKEIDAVAFTRGPGLLGSLLVGTSFAKAFTLARNIPLIEVNHMQAHILAHFIPYDNHPDWSAPEFPFLCLTVSGGHTQVVLVKDYFDMEIIGQTMDDAAGEAFDKTAKILDLPYPGGPLIDKYAKEGNPDAFQFPEPQIPGFDFSFSGLKTSILYFVRDKQKNDPEFLEKNMADVCASVQYRIITILLSKVKKAAKQYGIKSIAIAGGVSANSGLRSALKEMAQQQGWKVFIPEFQYCTDNAGMIAIAGYYKFLNKDFVGQDIAPLARMPF
ncbi:tRNA (adenosine(37)-N6)-threonylcarbamoyltransferase complex transferase subunit TsaD [Desertivirga arenae]|uniref:tRNA (adenosine(37)-N6)-threonylcarbamoyltransferase complex transferase subunit TsaD n=1 Tax=Desertivirga arenae TaxID=2810309 RepID=UPI001A95772E|nr:tRNA (adenosine(37)-N6)-threonylcarbamoyltransferase complex transferase subunit TsaD [Pedobacter sp. SYSU D00823]